MASIMVIILLSMLAVAWAVRIEVSCCLAGDEETGLLWADNHNKTDYNLEQPPLMVRWWSNVNLQADNMKMMYHDIEPGYSVAMAGDPYLFYQCLQQNFFV